MIKLRLPRSKYLKSLGMVWFVSPSIVTGHCPQLTNTNPGIVQKFLLKNIFIDTTKLILKFVKID